MYQQPQSVCPHCGYCPHCGRSNQPYTSPFGQPYMGGLDQMGQAGLQQTFGNSFGNGFGHAGLVPMSE